MTQPDQKFQTDAEKFAKLDALIKGLSKSQDFRSLGDELATADSYVLVAGIREAQNPSRSRLGVVSDAMRDDVPFPFGAFLTLGVIVIALGWVALKVLKFLLTLV